MKLIVGLGNPGKKYETTRHNMGFLTIDKICEKLNVSLDKKKFQGLYTKVKYKGEDLILLKPETYMNLSGNSVIEAMKFFKIESEDLYVFYDDKDLDLGVIRLRQKGSSGGHNGMKSIISHVGQDFKRIRLGIGKDPHYDTKDYVLGHFSMIELPTVYKACEKAGDSLFYALDENFEKAMNIYNRS